MNLFYKKHKVLFIAVFVFLFAYLITNPNGEFALNDDWNNQRQIEAYRMGEFRIHAEMDSSFILQGFIGMVWSYIFGTSFVSLRYLTAVFTILGILGLYKIFKLLNIDTRVALIGMLLFAFNPIIFNSSFSFMTENYFLAFLIWSIYFYLKWIYQNDIKHLILSILIASASILIRQIGVFIVAGEIAFFVINELYSFKNRKVTIRNALTPNFILTMLFSTLVCGFFMYVWVSWPNFGTNSSEGILLNGVGIQLEGYIERIKLFWQVFPYLSFFLLPLLFGYFGKLGKYLKIALLFSTLFFAYFLFPYDVFPIGNVFYIENYMVKKHFFLSFSIFDNIPFKVFLTYLVSLNILVFFVFLIGHIKYIKTDKYVIFLLLLSLSLFSFMLPASDYYDRYLVPGTVPLLICIAYLIKLQKAFSYRLAWFSLIIIIFMVFSLNLDFISGRKISWDQGRKIQESKNIITQVYVDGPFVNYYKEKKLNDYSGNLSQGFSGEYLCFVIKYNTEEDNIVFNTLSKTENFLGRYIDKPRVFNSTKRDIPKIQKRLDSLELNQEYTSVIYNLVGKKAYVGSFCFEDIADIKRIM